MIEKSVALDILKEIEENLFKENWKNTTLSTVNQYKKGLLIATNEELKYLVEESKKYSEESEEYKKIANDINIRISNIYNEKSDNNE